MPRPPSGRTNRPDGAQEMAVWIEKWKSPSRLHYSSVRNLEQINLMSTYYSHCQCEERSDAAIHEAVWIATGPRPSP
jgi:hypothetical protein